MKPAPVAPMAPEVANAILRAVLICIREIPLRAKAAKAKDA